MNKNNIGEIISNFRKNANITQEDLASMLGVDRSVISRWESGLRKPDLSIIPAIAKSLGVPVNALFSCYSTEIPNEIKYDETFISKYKSAMICATCLLFTPLSVFIATYCFEIPGLWDFLLGVGLTLVGFSVYILIKWSLDMKKLIVNEYNKPKYSILYKNYINLYLLVAYLIISIVISYLRPFSIIQILGISLYFLFVFFTILSISQINIKASLKKTLIIIIPSIVLLITSIIFMLWIEVLPYYGLMILSMILNYICVFVNNEYKR